MRDFNKCLERDPVHGSRWYDCVYQDELRPFQQDWRSSTIHEQPPPEWRGHFHRGPGMSLSDSPFPAYWRLARLAMNRHLFGASSGLPLECIDGLKQRFDGFTVMTENAVARVIDDGLFLVRKIIWKPKKEGTLVRSYCSSLETLKAPVCPHRISYGPLQPYVLFRGWGKARSELIPRRNVKDACRYCATDFQFTIERLKRQPGRKRSDWMVTMVCYHQLGTCRGKLEEWGFSRGGQYGHLVPHDEILAEGKVRKTWLANEEAGAATECPPQQSAQQDQDTPARETTRKRKRSTSKKGSGAPVGTSTVPVLRRSKRLHGRKASRSR